MHARKVGAVLVINERNPGCSASSPAATPCACWPKAGTRRLPFSRNVMTKKPACMPPHSTAIEALRLMRDGGFRHVPVVQEGVVVGIVSRGDFRRGRAGPAG